MGRGLRITSLGYIGVLRLELPVWGIWHVGGPGLRKCFGMSLGIWKSCFEALNPTP